MLPNQNVSTGTFHKQKTSHLIQVVITLDCYSPNKNIPRDQSLKLLLPINTRVQNVPTTVT